MPPVERRQVGVVAGVVLGENLAQPGVVAFVRRLPGLAAAKIRIGLRHLIQPTEDEVGLDGQRLLTPQRAVVVEHRHALVHGHAVCHDSLDEVDHGLLRGACVPAGQHLGLAAHPNLL
jgi:hypothetical protein